MYEALRVALLRILDRQDGYRRRSTRSDRSSTPRQQEEGTQR